MSTFIIDKCDNTVLDSVKKSMREIVATYLSNKDERISDARICKNDSGKAVPNH